MVAKGLYMDSRGQDEDPLTKAMAPPPNESEAERQVRLAAEREAQKRSDAIDEELNRQRINEKKTKCIRILLLGQSESGKSTTLKNFQLFHSNKAFRTERASWRAVIQLNVVRSVRLILHVMTEAQTVVSPAIFSEAEPEAKHPILTPEHLRLKMRLLPLQQVEETLLRKLTPQGSAEWETTRLSPVTNLPYSGRNAPGELALNSLTPWKNAFNRLVTGTRTSLDSQDIDFDDPNDPGVILNACKDDIYALWTDMAIKELFFLDQLDRVTSLKYVPTDAAWVPYFDNMDGIIFLAPISGFDQVLDEDPNVNRLEDSILLWKSVVSNKLLKDTEIVLFLNKIDIFKAKLASGVSFGHFVVSYGDRPNDFESTSKYLMRKFG
ncbi:hypothetical protein C0995_013254 [Termitomyces sp. Mi166|nr:hypothetical protein C0995_013254 [Termitomyces sp. Mi166\